jgi:phospholipase/carboxylesterase
MAAVIGPNKKWLARCWLAVGLAVSAVLNGALPSCRPLLRLPQARQLSVFIAHGIANAVLPLSAARQAASLLYTAGLNVQFRVYPTTHRLHPAMWQDANRWLMQLITARP